MELLDKIYGSGESNDQVNKSHSNLELCLFYMIQNITAMIFIVVL